MRFEFAISNRVLFGPSTVVEVPIIAASPGKSVLVVTDSQERSKELLSRLSVVGLSVGLFLIEKELDTDCARMATRIFQESSF